MSLNDRMSAATVQRLSPEDIDEVYVLVRLGYADLTLDDWRAMAARQIASPESTGGILIARDGGRRPLGLLLYSIAPKFAGRPSLQVERLISFDLIDPQAVADAMIEEVLKIAQIQDCDSLSLVRPLDAPPRAAALVLASGVSILHRVF